MIEASCHCGAVRLAVAARPEQVTSCNCSLCRRLGTLWAYYLQEEVGFLAGAGSTTAYIQGDCMLETHHCQTCGCTTHWISTDKGPAERIAINVRLLDPSEIEGLPVRHVDGAAM